MDKSKKIRKILILIVFAILIISLVVNYFVDSESVAKKVFTVITFLAIIVFIIQLVIEYYKNKQKERNGRVMLECDICMNKNDQAFTLNLLDGYMCSSCYCKTEKYFDCFDIKNLSVVEAIEIINKSNKCDQEDYDRLLHAYEKRLFPKKLDSVNRISKAYNYALEDISALFKIINEEEFDDYIRVALFKIISANKKGNSESYRFFEQKQLLDILKSDADRFRLNEIEAYFNAKLALNYIKIIDSNNIDLLAKILCDLFSNKTLIYGEALSNEINVELNDKVQKYYNLINLELKKFDKLVNNIYLNKITNEEIDASRSSNKVSKG